MISATEGLILLLEIGDSCLVSLGLMNTTRHVGLLRSCILVMGRLEELRLQGRLHGLTGRGSRMILLQLYWRKVGVLSRIAVERHCWRERRRLDVLFIFLGLGSCESKVSCKQGILYVTFTA